MTISEVLHRLWTNSSSKLGRREEKHLWMILQQFVERHGGLEASAVDYDMSEPASASGQIDSTSGPVNRITRACKRVRSLLRFSA
jgi:hypothetical protein